MNIIVTGASSGIGYETVKEFCKNGNHKIIAIARNPEKLSRLKGECNTINDKAEVISIVFDFGTDDIKATLIPELKLHFNSIDILLNNAGTLINKPFEQITEEDLIYIYKVNVFAPYILIQGLTPVFKPGAHIVNISSMGGFQGSAKFAGLSAYSSSKATLACLTECLAEELKGKEIKVNCLALGAVQTEMLQNAFPGYKADVSATQMGCFIADFCQKGHMLFNGKVLPVSLSTP